ncbi:hypothetical protein MKEN_00780000 [Mycena kentingensis (nom. inval.)]|nr:hypothetical protein MKEN_00780000 [Mycena kentingensis (nom. inval.)]
MSSTKSLILGGATLALSVMLAARVRAQVVIDCNQSGAAAQCSLENITTFCEQIVLSTYNVSDSISRCFSNSTEKGVRCDLTAVNHGPQTSVPNFDQCMKAMLTITNDCPMGGEMDFGVEGDGYDYYLDPNKGSCGPPCGDGEEREEKE